MKGLLRASLKILAMRFGKAAGLYLRFCRPDGTEWAEFLKRNGGFYQMGGHCSIQTNVTFTDPQYVKMGNKYLLVLTSPPATQSFR